MIEGLRIEESHPGHLAGLAGLFERNTMGCYCRFWHFGGWEIEWMERCTQPERNREELVRGLDGGSVDARGLVALVDDRVVGWLKLTPASRLAKLYQRRPYAKMPCFAGDRSGVYTVACVLVDEPWRRRGVARALVKEAVRAAARWGARSLEALPRTGTDDPHLMQMGPHTAFLEAGFEVAEASITGYPVLRRVVQDDSPDDSEGTGSLPSDCT